MEHEPVNEKGGNLKRTEEIRALAGRIAETVDPFKIPHARIQQTAEKMIGEWAQPLLERVEKLEGALRKAQEWAAGYPLHGSGSRADSDASTVVYAEAEAALAEGDV